MGRQDNSGVARSQLHQELSELHSLSGIQTTEPSFGLPATWVQEGDRAAAELRGYTVADPVTVLITHLGEVIRGHAAELVSRDDVQDLLDKPDWLLKMASIAISVSRPATRVEVSVDICFVKF